MVSRLDILLEIVSREGESFVQIWTLTSNNGRNKGT